MAGMKISQLDVLDTLSGDEKLVVAKEGDNYGVTVETLLNQVPQVEDQLSYGIEYDTTVSSRQCTRIGNFNYHRSLPIHSKMKGKLKAYGVRRHDKKREENLLALHETLKSDSFKNSKYDTYIIHEPKEREIFRLPYFPDRIVHHAIMNVLEPIWVSTFTSDTFSCIKERGISPCHVQGESSDEGQGRD